MGIHDRAYMRTGAPGRAPFLRSATFAALALLVLAFAAERIARGSSGRDVRPWLALSTDAVREARPWTLVTAAFVPADGWDLAASLAGLWYFGRWAEEALGRARFAWALALSVPAAHVVFLAGDAATARHAATAGAAGPVMAALVVAGVREPYAPVRIVNWVVRLWHVAAGFAVVEVAVAMRRDDTVLPWVHAGGAAFGYFASSYRFAPRWPWPRARRRPPPGPLAAGNEDRVDAILDKINEKGIAALTDEEREFLRRHSGRRP